MAPRLPRISDIIADNPVHRAVQGMKEAVTSARSDIKSLASALKIDSHTNTVVLKPKPDHAPAFVTPTEEETTIELKKRLLEEIVSAESDLTHKLKINGKACTCLDGKHNVKIIAMAREIQPKDPDNELYQTIIDWWENNAEKLTAKASASGAYDKEYLKMAGEQGMFRRRIQKELGTAQSIPVSSASEFLKEKRG